MGGQIFAPTVLLPGENPAIHRMWDSVCPVDGLDGLEEEKNLLPLPRFEPQFSMLYLGRYTDYAILHREIHFLFFVTK
jgi:hypothetical protein